jgi:hypothetical protein
MMLPGGRSSGAVSFAARDDIGAWFALHESTESCAMQRWNASATALSEKV